MHTFAVAVNSCRVDHDMPSAAQIRTELVAASQVTVPGVQSCEHVATVPEATHTVLELHGLIAIRLPDVSQAAMWFESLQRDVPGAHTTA